MRLNINKPLVVFDLETTGLDLVKDRIIQISYIKVMPSGEEIRENLFVNPGKHIPPVVQELTGISDADVANAPSFKEIAASLAAKFKGCDFAGFNSNHFDIPILAEEFLRAGVDFDFSSARLIDASTAPRCRKTLSASCQTTWTRWPSSPTTTTMLILPGVLSGRMSPDLTASLC